MRKPGIFVLVALLFLSCLGFGWVQKRVSEAELTSLNPAANTVVVANDSKSVLGHIASADGNHKALAGKDVSALIRHAHMAAEDRAFYTHDGISLWGIARAMVTNVQSGSVVAGGSTITQQYAKKFAGSEQTGERKVNEAIYARLIEKELNQGRNS
jgi:membrane peptidoglycan carboxypeptidase